MAQPQHQPSLRHYLHPGPDQRGELAEEEQAEIAMAQRAKSSEPAAWRTTLTSNIKGDFGCCALRLLHRAALIVTEPRRRIELRWPGPRGIKAVTIEANDAPAAAEKRAELSIKSCGPRYLP